MPDLVQEAIFSPDEKYLLVALNNGQVKKLLINPNDIIKLIDESYN